MTIIFFHLKLCTSSQKDHWTLSSQHRGLRLACISYFSLKGFWGGRERFDVWWLFVMFCFETKIYSCILTICQADLFWVGPCLLWIYLQINIIYLKREHTPTGKKKKVSSFHKKYILGINSLFFVLFFFFIALFSFAGQRDFSVIPELHNAAKAYLKITQEREWHVMNCSLKNECITRGFFFFLETLESIAFKTCSSHQSLDWDAFDIARGKRMRGGDVEEVLVVR